MIKSINIQLRIIANNNVHFTSINAWKWTIYFPDGDNLYKQHIEILLINEKIKKIPLLALYGMYYKLYLNNECNTSKLQLYKKQISSLNQEIINVVELLAELDVLNRLKNQNQDYYLLSLKVKHLYDDKYWYVHSFKPSDNNLSAFIYWLNAFSQNNPLINTDRNLSMPLAFKLALDIYKKYFQPKCIFH